jgi:single-strand DNA-binding protein
MSRGTMNKIMLIGRVGREAQMRYTLNGTAIAMFSIATNQSYKTKDGQYRDETDWHKVIAWRRLAEVCGEYLRKGTLVCVEGQMKTRVFEDKDGQKKFFTEVIADSMQMLDSKTRTVKKLSDEEPAKPESDTMN